MRDWLSEFGERWSRKWEEGVQRHGSTIVGLSPKTSSRLSMSGALYGDKGVG